MSSIGYIVCVYNTVVNNLFMGAQMISGITFIIYVHSQKTGEPGNSSRWE